MSHENTWVFPGYVPTAAKEAGRPVPALAMQQLQHNKHLAHSG